MSFLSKGLVRADLVIIPDAHRAKMIASAWSLTKEPVVVMNCPLLIPHLPPSRLLPALRERGIVTTKIAHYQGAIGPDHHLETIISSMPCWPNDAVFVLSEAPETNIDNDCKSMPRALESLIE